MLATFTSIIEDTINTGLNPGAQAYVLHRGQCVCDLALGEAAPGVPMRTDTILPWLSAGKPLGAAAIALLWQRGRLDLDDPVARHIPEFAQNGKEKATVRHLLTHTGGFRAAAGNSDLDWDAMIQRICAAPLEPRWFPGERAGYDPAGGWFMLGEIVRRLDGQPFETFVAEEIFRPLSMDDCYFALDAAELTRLAPRLGVLYDSRRQPPAAPPAETPRHAGRCRPGSSARGPASALARFYQMLLQRGENILSPQTVEAMTSRQRVGLVDHTFKRPIDWGLGFLIDSKHYGPEPVPYGYGPHASRRTFGHGGNQCAAGLADPEHQLAAAVLLNGTPDEARHQERMLRLLTALYVDLRLAAA